MSPAEVVVLAAKVAFACSALIVIRDDIFLGVVPNVGDNASVHILSSKDAFYLLRR